MSFRRRTVWLCHLLVILRKDKAITRLSTSKIGKWNTWSVKGCICYLRWGGYFIVSIYLFVPFTALKSIHFHYFANNEQIKFWWCWWGIRHRNKIKQQIYTGCTRRITCIICFTHHKTEFCWLEDTFLYGLYCTAVLIKKKDKCVTSNICNNRESLQKRIYFLIWKILIQLLVHFDPSCPCSKLSSVT